MLIRSIIKRKKTVKENNNIPEDFVVYSQELQKKRDDVITIHPTMYKEEVVEDKESHSDKDTAYAFGTGIKVKEYLYNEDKNIEDSSPEEVVVNPCNILKKNRSKAEKSQEVSSENSKVHEKNQVSKSKEVSEKREVIERKDTSEKKEVTVRKEVPDKKEEVDNKKEPKKIEEFDKTEVTDKTDDYNNNLMALLEKVNDLSTLIYDVTSRTNQLTQNAVANLSDNSPDNTQTDTDTQKGTVDFTDSLAADTAKLSELAEELKNRALNFKY